MTREHLSIKGNCFYQHSLRDFFYQSLQFIIILSNTFLMIKHESPYRNRLGRIMSMNIITSFYNIQILIKFIEGFCQQADLTCAVTALNLNHNLSVEVHLSDLTTIILLNISIIIVIFLQNNATTRTIVVIHQNFTKSINTSIYNSHIHN